jgi:hypothetical protein
MTSYVPKLIRIIFEAVGSGDQPSDLVEARDALIQAVTQNVSTEVCIESLLECWSSVKHTRKVHSTLDYLTLDAYGYYGNS